MFGPLRALADKRSSARDASPARRAGAERYVTDGINLYRVVHGLRGPRGRGVVGVEDCRSLELMLLPADEFRALKLRPVRRAAAS
jgi:hypothetical protein